MATNRTKEARVSQVPILGQAGQVLCQEGESASIATYDEGYPYLKTVVEQAEEFPLSPWRAVRAYIDFFLPLKLRPGQTILDIGSCIGTLGHHFRFAGIRTVGIDLNAAAIRTGREIYGQERNNQALQANAIAIPSSPRIFDAVISIDVWEHLPNEWSAREALSEATRVLKGRRMLHKITVLEDGACMHADPTHKIKWPARQWRQWFESQGWRVIAPTTKRFLAPSLTEKTIRVDAMYGYFLLERRPV